MNNLRKENDKLEQDIAVMENTLYQQKARLLEDSSISSQISKATGNSKWLSGAKGQISGYRSHKELLQNQNLSDKTSNELAKQVTRAKSAGVTGRCRRGRTQSFTPVASRSQEDVATSQPFRKEDRGVQLIVAKGVSGSEQGRGNMRVKSAPVRHGTNRKAGGGDQHKRAQSLQGGIKINTLLHSQKTSKRDSLIQSGKLSKNGDRRVSFDLSKEEESPSSSTSPSNPVSDHGQPVIKTVTRNPANEGSTSVEGASYSERIAYLKAKVMAKASANLKPELLSNFPKEKKKLASGGVTSQSGTNKGRKKGGYTSGSSYAVSGGNTKHVRNAKMEPTAQKHKSAIAENHQRKPISHQDFSDAAGHPKRELNEDDDVADFFFDAPVELWLCSLHVEDSLECVKIFRHCKITMDRVPTLTENQLIEMGVAPGPSLVKILQGIEELNKSRKLSSGDAKRLSQRGNESNGQSLTKKSEETPPTTKFLDLTGRDTFEEVLTLKDPSSPPASSTPASSSWSSHAHLNPEQSKKPITVEMSRDLLATEIKGSKESWLAEEDLKVDLQKGTCSPDLNRGEEDKSGTHRTKIGKGNVKKRGKSLSADVVNRTLTSGIQSAMTKLRLKQEQEANQQRRLDRLRQAKRAERDRLAQQYARRQQEKLEQLQAGEGEDRVGRAGEESEGVDEKLSSVVASAKELQDRSSETDGLPTKDIMKLNIQGGALLSRSVSSNQTDQDDVITEPPRARKSPRQTPEERLEDLEIKIQGLQHKDFASTVASQVEKLQQQLASLRRDLAAAHTSVSASSEPVRASTRAEGHIKSAGPARGVYSSMSKTELMREVRKQKEQHKKQIRLLESELGRLKHRDPVKNCELPERDILYHEEDLIGEGTFSRVFHGLFNGSEVAIKRLKIPLDIADRNYFAEEVSLLHELRHPRVVLLLGVCATGTLPLMVLEYMAGGSLYARIHDKLRGSLDHVAYYQIARDIALGMNYLHRHHPQVLHLDLKSMNVLLGLHGRAKIGDFGFAKLRHEAESLEKSKVQGTPAWMAPELMENTASSLTDKVDVYSFGVIMWEMLTGLIPYKGLSVFQVLDAVQKKKRPDIPESCPQPLRCLIKSCWEHKPNKRPSFKDILISLEALAFPPEWRSLLSAANIPREAMEDPASARSIIALVGGSIEMTQRELDEAVLASHERAVDVSDEAHPIRRNSSRSPSGGREQHLDDRIALALTSDSISEDIEDDSLDEETDSSNKYQTLQDSGDAASRLRLNQDDSKQTPTSSRQPTETKEESSCSPPKDAGICRSMARQEVPAPPPIQLMVAKPSPIDNRNNKQNPGQSPSFPRTRYQDSQQPFAGRVSLDSGLLAAQRRKLRSTEACPHPSQLPSLSELGEQRITSIAEILKKAVATRRTALREDVHSLEYPNSESVWSATSEGN
ncbi:uncharacterized protein LOC110976918 isoform X2 [Acanthaster planci]|nr:uncharacterized protein LOC110976918 isoform X2 [Acanthaster planci]